MDIKGIKKEAFKNFKKNMFKIILVSFIAYIVINGGYHYSSLYKKANNPRIDTVINKVDDVKDSFFTLLGANVNQRGLIAPLLNNMVNSDSITMGTVMTFNSMLLNNNLSTKIMLFISLLISFAFFIFVQNIIKVGEKRYFLEQRRYKSTKVDRLLYVYQVRKTISVASTMFKRFFYQLLWMPTIYFGFKKFYEYKMIPYILAINPSISDADAFRLSKELSDDHKLDMFKLDLSLIGYYVLHILTFGLSSLFYFNGYKEAIYTELYIKLYEEKKATCDLKLLEDDYLYIEEYQNKMCPSRLVKSKTLEANYNKSYSATTYILFFFTFAMVGWLWEVIFCFILSGDLANRGTYQGPWLPIYGYGCVLILLLLKKLRDKHFLYFISSMLLCGTVEYLTACYLEFFKGMRWWEYDSYFLNIHGRVCLESLLVFGLAGCAVTYLAAPILNNIYSKIKPKIKIILCVILLSCFISDAIYSHYYPNQGNGVTIEISNN